MLAGSSIVPAHPRTRVTGVSPRSTLALAWDWYLPEEIGPAEAERLTTEQRSKVLREVWPVTPMPYLGFRTPEQAARDGDAEVPLRAALVQFERSQATSPDDVPGALRVRLGIPPEPTIDPTNVDIARVPLARLAGIDMARLDDESLILLYQRARRGMLPRTLEEAARTIAGRPSLFRDGKVDPVAVFSDLASIAAGLRDAEQVRHWVAQGRAADSPTTKARNAPIWDMVEVRLRARLERPETWVPELAIVLERYGQDPAANQVLLMNLIEMGLIQVVPNPDNPKDVMVDSRTLQAVLAEYGPRVTTASGRLGVSATKPDLWTPGGPASGGGGGGALWTPGSGQPAAPAAPAGGEKSRLILPGR